MAATSAAAAPAAALAPPTGEQVMEAARKSEEARAKKIWLHAWHDPVAGLKSFTSCVRLADLSGDGESKLLVAGTDKRLKIYKGTTLLSENMLLAAPVSVCVFYPDAKKAPSVGVAAGPFVFIYRNLRPYYKFSLPLVVVGEKESETWGALHEGKISIGEAREALGAARDGGDQLTNQSQDLLAIEEDGEAGAYVAACAGKKLSQQTVATCMEVLKKEMDDDDAVSMLVVGTEAKQVLVLDAAGSSILVSATLVSVPVFLGVTGLYSVDYRVVCACRDGNVYTIKNGEVTGNVIELEAMPCALCRIDKSVLVGCMSNTVHAFHIKGKRQYSLYVPAPIACMEVLTLTKTRNLRALLVGLNTGEVRLYHEKSLVATLQLGHSITALRFGAYGREEAALICIGDAGSLTIKMMQRQADLDGAARPPGPPPEQDVPLSIPKKTKLYVEQTQREREQATDMHRVFQRDLCKLRLSTARAYVKIISDGQGPMSYSAGSSLRMTAQVQGLGPKFKLKLNVQNTGGKSVTHLAVTFNFNAMLYKLKQPLYHVPLLLPGVPYKIDAELECIDENGGADAIRVIVCNPKSVLPVLSAVVNMPISEQLIKDE
jgi:Bardet-Biedl syndrome 1 protein